MPVQLDEPLVRSKQRLLLCNQQLVRLCGRRGSQEQTLFQSSALLGVFDELRVQEVKQLFFDDQALDLEAKPLYLMAKALVLETGRM